MKRQAAGHHSLGVERTELTLYANSGDREAHTVLLDHLPDPRTTSRITVGVHVGWVDHVHCGSRVSENPARLPVYRQVAQVRLQQPPVFLVLAYVGKHDVGSPTTGRDMPRFLTL
ncbi:unnamed protein product [Ixodes pacificus]